MNEIRERLERLERERGRKFAVLIERELCISWLCLPRGVGSVLLQLEGSVTAKISHKSTS